ncbi:MAG: hypothetical protein AAGF58_08335 [Pseudomonadota bacterium]
MQPTPRGRSHALTKILVLGGLIALAGCQWTGQGPVTLSSFSAAGYSDYDDIIGDKAFALTTDGRWFGYAYCTDVRCSGNEENEAMRVCEQGAEEQGLPGGECRIFARDNTIVWDGQVNFPDDT